MKREPKQQPTVTVRVFDHAKGEVVEVVVPGRLVVMGKGAGK